MSTLVLLLIGLGAGILSGVFGIGGGIVIVPALIYLAGMSAQQAAGTSLAALVLPLGAAVGAYTYYRAGFLEIKPAVIIAIGMMAGAFIGAQVATNVNAILLQRGFAVLLLGMAVKLWIG